MSIGTHPAIRLTLTGRVQGLGVRPAIARWARQLSLTGWVVNTCQGVEVVAEGSADKIERFTSELPRQLPNAAVVEMKLIRELLPRHPSDTFWCRIERMNLDAELLDHRDIPEDVRADTERVRDAAARNQARADHPASVSTSRLRQLAIDGR